MLLYILYPQIMRMLLTSSLTTAIPTRSTQYDSEDDETNVALDIKHPKPSQHNEHSTPTPAVDLELIALAVNLAANKQCAELICGQDGEGLKLVEHKMLIII